jgi:hypothetical protein
LTEPEPVEPESAELVEPESRSAAGAAASTVRFADPPTTAVLRYELSEQEVQRKRAVVEEEWSDSESEEETDDNEDGLDPVARLRLRLAGAAAQRHASAAS